MQETNETSLIPGSGRSYHVDGPYVQSQEIEIWLVRGVAWTLKFFKGL